MDGRAKMKAGFRSYLLSSAAALAVFCIVCIPAHAQRQGSGGGGTDSNVKAIKPLPKGGPTPRTADGHPDLSGVWFPGVTGDGNLNDVGLGGSYNLVRQRFDPKKTPPEPIPFQPWAAAKLKEMFPTEVDAQLHSPSVLCMPRGVPLSMSVTPYPIQIIQTRELFVQLNEDTVDYRVVPMDGRPHPQDPDPKFNGDGVAHWEGDTLVIDTVGIDERTWNNLNGWFHSDQEHVVERISRPSVNYLNYQVTIEDPKVLTKPWTSPVHNWSLGHEPLQEFYCTHTEESNQYGVLKNNLDANGTK
jgi:hypothetical protein